MIDDGAPARPAWRTVHKREERRAKAKAKALPPPTPAPAAIAPPPDNSNLPAWAQWKREYTKILCSMRDANFGLSQLTLCCLPCPLPAPPPRHCLVISQCRALVCSVRIQSTDYVVELSDIPLFRSSVAPAQVEALLSRFPLDHSSPRTWIITNGRDGCDSVSMYHFRFLHSSRACYRVMLPSLNVCHEPTVILHFHYLSISVVRYRWLIMNRNVAMASVLHTNCNSSRRAS